MEDEKIVELFFRRSEQAIAELDLKYGRICHRLSFNILNNRRDAEECVNDAYLGAWNAIPPVKPNPLRAYLCKIVRNISLKAYYRKEAAKRNSEYDVAIQELEAYLSAPDTVEAELEARELARIMENFLNILTAENRVIFMRRYWFSDSCRDIAEHVGLTEKCIRPAYPHTQAIERISGGKRGFCMNTKKFSEAMSEIDGKYVDEAIHYQRRVKRPGWMKWGAVAACFCLIAVSVIAIPSLLKLQESDEEYPAPDVVAAPGFLTLTVYAASPEGDITPQLPPEEEIMMQEGIEVPVNHSWSLAMSSRPGIPLKLSAPEHPDTMFEVSVDGGELLLWDSGKIIYLGSSYGAENDSTVYWTSMTRTGDGDFEPYSESEVYVTIVIREDKNIVGYAVVKIDTDGPEDDPSQTYYATLLKSVSFPKVNGEYQKITADYVAAEMEQVGVKIIK